MPTPLVDQLNANPERSRRLSELMAACRDRYRVVAVTVIGCGDAFINRYWPKLQLLVNQQWLKLTVVDTKPLDALIDHKLTLARESGNSASAERLGVLYEDFSRVLRERPRSVRYLVKSFQNAGATHDDNLSDENLYWHLTTDIVFVLVPDNIHISYARHWLKRATLVLIEKPYNRDVVEAISFEKELADLVAKTGVETPHTFVVCIDHYLAKIHRYVTRHSEEDLQQQISVIKRIEFSICEAGAVEPWRATSLEGGMVYDLFCHALAQISPFVQLEPFFRPRWMGQILAARHKDAPINTETYAAIKDISLRDRLGRSVLISGRLGKGVGRMDQKFLRIVGEEGTLFGDFGPGSDGMLSIEAANGLRAPLFEIAKGHPEMLDAIFEGRFMKEPVGGLTGETAVQILQILTSIRTRIEQNAMPLLQAEHAYEVGAAPIEIEQTGIRLT